MQRTRWTREVKPSTPCPVGMDMHVVPLWRRWPDHTGHYGQEKLEVPHLRVVSSGLAGSGKPVSWAAGPSSTNLCLCTSQLVWKCDTERSRRIRDAVRWSGLETLWVLQQLHPLCQEKLDVHVPLEDGTRVTQETGSHRKPISLMTSPTRSFRCVTWVALPAAASRHLILKGSLMWGMRDPACLPPVNKFKGMWNPSNFL